MARLGESGSELLSRLMTEGLKLTLLTALEGGCSLTNNKKKNKLSENDGWEEISMSWTYFWCIALATL